MYLRTADSYKFQWKGEVASGGAMTAYNYNNAYTRRRNKTGKLELVCNDMNYGGVGTVEGAACEGGILPRIDSN